MSGGYFDYEQYKIGQIADQVEQLILTNASEEKNEWGDDIGAHFTANTIAEFKTAVTLLRRAEVYAQRIDWLVSGDDGEESFHARLQDGLSQLESKNE